MCLIIDANKCLIDTDFVLLVHKIPVYLIVEGTLDLMKHGIPTVDSGIAST